MFKVAFTREIKPDFISNCIMKFLATNYSHVFFIHDGQIFHATGEGVNQVTLSDYLKTHQIVAEFEVSLAMTPSEFVMFMEGSKGKEYSSSQYLGFIFPFLKRFTRNGNEKMICSELVAAVLEKNGGYKLPKEADFMSPKDVYDLLKGNI